MYQYRGRYTENFIYNEDIHTYFLNLISKGCLIVSVAQNKGPKYFTVNGTPHTKLVHYKIFKENLLAKTYKCTCTCLFLIRLLNPQRTTKIIKNHMRVRHKL